MASPEEGTIRSIRGDLALQIARFIRRSDITQTTAALRLGIPQPTVSKIINGRVSNLSVELLIRVAVRAGLALTLQTGRVPEEAGAFVSNPANSAGRLARSALADAARESMTRSEQRLSPSQRLEAFLEHNQLLAALGHANRRAQWALRSTSRPST